MATGTINKTTVDKQFPQSRDSYLWDSSVKGFGLKITPKGRKVYLLQYKVGRRTRRVMIGVHGPLTPQQARSRAQEILGEIATGRDPAAERAQQRFDQSGPTTIEELLPFFMDSHVRAKRRPRTAEEYQRQIDLHIQPRLGSKQVAEVVYGDIERFHASLRHKPVLANRCVATLSMFFTWCIRNGYRPHPTTNPCAGLQKFKETPRERYLDIEEVSALGNAIAKGEKEGRHSIYAFAAIKVLVLTGARRQEVLTLRWDSVDLKRGTLNLSESKTGKKSIVLSDAAIELLASLPRIDDNPYCFPGTKSGEPIYDCKRAWHWVREEAGLPDRRIHDLRHSLASFAAANNHSLPIIGALLGHRSSAATNRYTHLADNPVRSAANEVTRELSERLRGGNR
ncbi:MAG: tyrosine-type recombinase/integrase [Pseudomonadota bacterium]